MAPQHPDTEQLLDRAGQGDAWARNCLLERHRARLRALIALRMDRRLAARVDPSDVVQESLAEADGKLADYVRTRPLPFYLWLRALVLERLVDLHRRHVRAQKRSIRREEVQLPGLSDESLEQLAQRLVARGSHPSARLQREELRTQLAAALARLPERDREVLVLRHFEQLSIREIAAVLGSTEGAVKVRQVRALQRLRGLLGDILGEDLP
jgi:RNA polymerase sigma-70 factor (ECF subfamily)